MNDSLETLLADGIIEAIIGQLKTGKEAEVWLVQHAGEVVAAKLYKERHERNFRNNAGYREGREVRNSRTRRAIEKGSRFGQNAAEDAWKSAESDSLYKLHAQGVRVPTPVLFYEGILLMEVVLDAEGHPAPRMVEAPPATPEDAHALYVDLRAQVINMLCADLIHGDLSPYNILMSYAGPVIIDFPQTVAAARNNSAEFYFRRDLDNVRNFLASTAPWLHGTAGETGEIWNAYVRRELTPDFVPSGNFREGPRQNGRGGARGQGSRPQGEERRGGFRPPPQPAPAEQAAAPQRDLTPEEAAEAELRELEALVLRQGGGERGKPAVAAPPPRGGRNRGAGGGRPPPRNGAGNGARPPPNGQRMGGGGPGRPGSNAPRANGGPQGGPRSNEPRASNGAFQGGPRSNEPRASNGAFQGGPRSNEPRAKGRLPGGPRQNEPRSNGAPTDDARASGRRDNGGWRQNEPRADDGGTGGPLPRERFAEGASAGGPRQSDPRNGRPPRSNNARGGDSDVSGAEQRVFGNARPPRNEPRGDAPTSPMGQGGGPRGGGPRADRNERRGNGRQDPVVETRAEPGAPPQNLVREPRQGNGGNSGGPRPQRQPQGRGGPRPPRPGGPQVSYVARPGSSSDPGSHEAGS
ncbi:RIO1 family regulatory kinase/ATPase [Corallococcus macrosporus]|uniref:non-specific serine/threonine protein kinase n=1 Tax=Myxococcus fulvus (strain ATCC BAA-855 / HW-1) TaxID=483219 RepID=F8C955_MYXFH|nr:RIO1 family regulatory kinase/ATPase [Corallococcus macrosporus]AEI65756.1 RIO1 family protein [Corallococcus macrosporus]